ncbi:AIPR family protein [Marinobacter piscensis]|uniref:AIPR family protein n=1 Tax=Marinobacter piscensis TaxID=1562308 RepID=UPI0011A6043C|nr:AIPR family protein [Marinobacter piscensis]
MNINLLYLDQMVNKTAESHLAELGGQADRAVSKAFVFLAAKTLLDLDSDEEVLDCIYDGRGDFGIDALYISDIVDESFHVKIFQGKYTRLEKSNGASYEGGSHFPANDVQKMVSVVRTIFDPNQTYQASPQLKARIEEIRSIMVNEGIIPSIEIVLCNNGLPVNREGQDYIDNAHFPDYVNFRHFNHDDFVALSKGKKKVDEHLKFAGYRIVEDFNRKRFFLGKVPVSEFHRIFESHGDVLLERNIRKFLGTKSNKVNSSIAETLRSPEKNKDFFFMNNGVTIVTSKITYNNLQEKDVRVDMKGMHIINGGQTCKTIHTVLSENPGLDVNQCFVLVRIYELDDDNDDIISKITVATNSQSVVDLSDLKSNDEIQRTLAHSVPLLGEKDGKPLYVYQTKRGEKAPASVYTPISLGVAAEAVLSVWRAKPNNARFHKNKLFGQLYDEIFGDLNAAQLVLAVSIWRYVENKRKHESENYIGEYLFLPYASNVLAMQIGHELLREKGLTLAQVTPQKFPAMIEAFETNKETLYNQALTNTKHAMEQLGIRCEEASLQRIAATFRRADLTVAIRQRFM